MTDVTGPARLGANPEWRYVGEGDNKKAVCKMRVKFLNDKLNKNSEDWEDNGFWANVDVWGKCAESAVNLFVKGDRILVINGNMVENSWPDKEDAEKTHSMMQVNTNSIAPYIPDLESLKYRPRKTNEEAVSQDVDNTAQQKAGTDG